MTGRKRYTGKSTIAVLVLGIIISGIMGTGAFAESVETEAEISVQASMVNTETWVERDVN